MANYRQHVTFAGFLGVAYAGAAYVFVGIHWAYGSVAALLTTLSGLLPDLDAPSGVQLRGFTGLLGVLAALSVWQALGEARHPPAFEYHLWAVVATFVLVRHGLRRLMTRISVHRGISHSLPASAVWGALAYLYYPTAIFRSADPPMMALAVVTGFFSHLLLDEICSVDLRGARVNKAFGTAIKLWAPSPWTTLGMYLLLSYLTWRIIQTWPDDPSPARPPAESRLPINSPAGGRSHSACPEEWDLRSDAHCASRFARRGFVRIIGQSGRARRRPCAVPDADCHPREIRSMRAIARSGLLALACWSPGSRPAPKAAPKPGPAAGHRRRRSPATPSRSLRR